MKFLQDLNQSIDNVIKELENDKYMQNPDYFNFIKNSMDVICKKNSFCVENSNTEIPIIHEDKIFDIILSFFQSLDKDFYDKVNQILHNNYPNTKTYIYDFHLDDPKGTTQYSILYFDGRAEIFFPLGYRISKEKLQEIRNTYGEDFYTLDDLYSIAHELAHLLDINPQNFTKEPSSTREILAEVTPGIFENLLTDFLLQNGFFDKTSIINKKNSINNKLLTHANLTRLKLLLADIKNTNGIITKEDILNLMKSESLDDKHFQELLYLIAYSDTNITTGKRYAFSSLCSPIISEKCKSNNIHLLKKYLNESSENLPFTDILKSFGIDLNRDIALSQKGDEIIK
ncbi:MAG: hypothetical protein E7313_06195 [Clostridiales bacterium]|nr:hypothetical protein [Clostridiales bacterium]